MKKSQNSFIMPILLVVVLLIFAACSYVYLQNKDEQSLATPTDNTSGSTASNEINFDSASSEFAGMWIAGANDFLHIELDLLKTGEFHVKSYFLSDQQDVFNGTGNWKLTEKDNQKYLLLTHSENIYTLKEEKMIEQYKKWGQEFIGDNQALLEITTDKYGTHFRLEGMLMEKSISTSE